MQSRKVFACSPQSVTHPPTPIHTNPQTPLRSRRKCVFNEIHNQHSIMRTKVMHRADTSFYCDLFFCFSLWHSRNANLESVQLGELEDVVAVLAFASAAKGEHFTAVWRAICYRFSVFLPHRVRVLLRFIWKKGNGRKGERPTKRVDVHIELRNQTVC